MTRADEHCPYSNATRGNIPVPLSVDRTPIQRAAAWPCGLNSARAIPTGPRLRTGQPLSILTPPAIARDHCC